MTQALEPPRLLLDEAADPIVRQLLRASNDDGPSRERLLTAPVAIATLIGAHAVTQSATACVMLGTGKAATTAGSAAATTLGGTFATTSAASVLPALTKSVLIGLCVGGALVTTVPNIATPRRTEIVSSTPGVQGPRVPLRESAETVPAGQEIAPAPSLAAAPKNSATPPRNDSRSSRIGIDREQVPAPMIEPGDISREVALLDAARSALGRNQPADALAQLDRYRALSRRTLAPEATILRVRALLAAGQRQQAENVAAEFTRSNPNAPQVQLLRQLLGMVDFSDPD